MIDVTVHREIRLSRFTVRSIRDIVVSVCKRERVHGARFSFVFVNDRSIRAMHKRYFGHDTVTDIITFPLETAGIDSEIYINVEQARRQSKQFKVTMKNELTRLIVHGVLHSLGYDDRTPSLRKKMFDVQERYVEDLS